MPQLDSSSYVSQIFWLTVTFLSLWFLMSFFIIPKIKSIIDEREQKITEYIQKAERINQQANEALQRYETALFQTKTKTAAQITRDREAFEKMLSQKQDEADKLLEQKIALNEQILKQEREETLKVAEEISKQTAQVILKKLGFDIKEKDREE